MSLVADYDSDSDSAKEIDFFGLDRTEDSDDDTQKSEENKESADEKTNKVLPSPFNSSQLSQSVFSNPFREAEEAKNSILERHVKMTASTESDNPKQICWNFRKGRCRFGKKCKYSHGSGPIIPVNDEGNTSPDSTTPAAAAPEASAIPILSEEEEPIKRKKRPGLSQTITPSKKVMTAYYKQQGTK